MVKIKNGKIVVELREYGIYQPFDPDTRQNFADEAEAQAWEDATVLKITNAMAEAEVNAAAERDAQKAAEIHLVIEDLLQMEYAENTPITINAQINNGMGALINTFSESFSVPIIDGDGKIVKIKRISFVNGVASATLTFTKSGYYKITEKDINSRLPEGAKIHFAQGVFEITIYEA